MRNTPLVEPQELQYYSFLNDQNRTKIDNFINKFDSKIRTFAIKRYLERKTISKIAEEMGYSERNLFKFRKKILVCWYISASDDN